MFTPLWHLDQSNFFWQLNRSIRSLNRLIVDLIYITCINQLPFDLQVKSSCNVVYLVNLDIMDKTVPVSIRSHLMEMHVLHNATVVPATVIMLAAVDNCQR